MDILERLDGVGWLGHIRLVDSVDSAVGVDGQEEVDSQVNQGNLDILGGVELGQVVNQDTVD